MFRSFSSLFLAYGRVFFAATFLNRFPHASCSPRSLLPSLLPLSISESMGLSEARFFPSFLSVFPFLSLSRRGARSLIVQMSPRESTIQSSTTSLSYFFLPSPSLFLRDNKRVEFLTLSLGPERRFFPFSLMSRMRMHVSCVSSALPSPMENAICA